MMFVIVAAVFLVLLWFIAKEFQNIAKMKGHPEERYFWWCFLTSFYGYLMVIALPDRSEKNGSAQTAAEAGANEKADDELPYL